MGDLSGPVAVCDANVLIDLFSVDEDLVREMVRYWKIVYVPDVVLFEVTGLSLQRAASLGLTVLETPLVLPVSQRLSFQDRACLHFATLNKWVCIANDVRLRKDCEAQGCRVVWGLEMLLLLVTSGQITRERALDCGRKIHAENPAITVEVLGQFERRLVKEKTHRRR